MSVSLMGRFAISFATSLLRYLIDGGTVGISFAIAIPCIALAVKIVPVMGILKVAQRFMGRWGVKALRFNAGALLIILTIVLTLALSVIAAGLVVAAGAVALALLVLYFVALVLFYLFKWIWECTPYYHRREARKRREQSDLEDAARDGGPEIHVSGGSLEDGKVDEDGDGVAEKGIAVTQKAVESQHESGDGEEIGEAH